MSTVRQSVSHVATLVKQLRQCVQQCASESMRHAAELMTIAATELERTDATPVVLVDNTALTAERDSLNAQLDDCMLRYASLAADTARISDLAVTLRRLLSVECQARRQDLIESTAAINEISAILAKATEKP